MVQKKGETMAVSFKGAHFPQDIILNGSDKIRQR
jgi:hypothetical protein